MGQRQTGGLCHEKTLTWYHTDIIQHMAGGYEEQNHLTEESRAMSRRPSVYSLSTCNSLTIWSDECLTCADEQTNTHWDGRTTGRTGAAVSSVKEIQHDLTQNYCSTTFCASFMNIKYWRWFVKTAALLQHSQTFLFSCVWDQLFALKDCGCLVQQHRMMQYTPKTTLWIWITSQ